MVLLLSVHLSVCLSVTVDVIDIVNDSLTGSDYLEEEDPSLYHSSKTNRGPLGPDWIQDPPGGIIMCSYKLIKVCVYHNLFNIHYNNYYNITGHFAYL